MSRETGQVKAVLPHRDVRGEARIEWRWAVAQCDGVRLQWSPNETLARRNADHARASGFDAWVERQTVTESPWERVA